MKNLTIDQATELFETHPKTNEFFVTTDGQAFFTQEHADSHGQRLKDRSVEIVTRKDFEAAPGEGKVVELVKKTRKQLDADYLALFGEASNPDISDDDVASAIAQKLADTAPAKTALEIAQETPESERTSYQKGIITKAANAASTPNA